MAVGTGGGGERLMIISWKVRTSAWRSFHCSRSKHYFDFWFSFYDLLYKGGYSNDLISNNHNVPFKGLAEAKSLSDFVTSRIRTHALPTSISFLNALTSRPPGTTDLRKQNI